MRYSTFTSVTLSLSAARTTCRETISPARRERRADRAFLGPSHLEIELCGDVLLVLLVQLRDQHAAGRLGDRVAQGLVGRGHVGDRDLERRRLARGDVGEVVKLHA